MIKFRDLFLLFVGAGLVFFAILIADLIQTDAQADNRLNPPVEYQYAVLHMYLDNLQSYSRIYHNQYQVFPYTQISNIKYEYLEINDFMEQVLNAQSKEGWFLDQLTRDPDGDLRLILKRVKQ